MFKYALLVLTLYVCLVSCKDLACKDLSGNRLFADSKNPHIYHHCSYGKDKGTVECQNGEVFNEPKQTCIAQVIVDQKCPGPNGQFEYPGNPHRFLVCYQGHAYMFECPADTVWSQSLKHCTDNVDGKTWSPSLFTTKLANISNYE